MNDHHKKLSEEQIHWLEQQVISLDHLGGEGYILDIGGGGEGVIGILEGDRVVAIDRSKRELAEAAAGPLKIIMDARELQFLDESFDLVTAFFSLMYIAPCDHKQVFREVWRVLEPGGQFLVWELLIPPRVDKGKHEIVIPLLVKIDGREVETGYGVRWPDEGRDLAYFEHLAEVVGLETLDTETDGQMLYLRLRKPDESCGTGG